uniref:Uncharacterized protein n=1 Tax=Arundo donax TaxID=35708 RepID=A0A0A9BRI9_ARUDO
MRELVTILIYGVVEYSHVMNVAATATATVKVNCMSKLHTASTF